MPFARPTLTQHIQQIAADIVTGLQSTTSLLRFSNLTILGKALAKAVNGLYGYLDWIALQGNPFTATDEYAVAWGALKGVTVKTATAASGLITFSGTDGNIIPAESVITRGDGTPFITSADATISAGTAAVEATAQTAGSAGNSAPGATFTLSTAIPGVSSSAVAISGTSGGADVEASADFKSRYLQVYANPPQGGAEPDYEQWATNVAGVTRAWVSRNGMGPGTVVVYFMMDVVEAAFDGFPQGTNGVATNEVRDTAATGDQLPVANAIYPVQPVTALVYAVAPSRNTLDVTIAGVSGASTAIKGAITAAIKAAVVSGGKPGGETQVSVIERAIAAVSGSDGFVITNIAASAGTVSPGAAGNITANAGALSVLGTVTFS